MALQSLKPTHPPSFASKWAPKGIAVALAIAFFFFAIGQSASAAETDWRTGSDFRNHLQTDISLTWQSRGLREGLETLARSQRVAIFLDRRVDPGVRITFTCDGTPVETAIRGIAAKAKLGVGFVGPVIYVGPPLTCAGIATLSEVRNEQVKDLPAAAHKRLLRKNPTAWPDLVEPQLLLARMATTAGLTIPNIQSVPHDIWRSIDLPDMTFAEQAVLVSAGFDLSFRWHANARQIFLIRYPKATSIRRVYGSADPEKLAKQLAKLLPQAFVEVEESRVVVRSTLEDHWEIERTRGTKGVQQKAPKDPKDERYTLTVKQQPTEVLFKLLTKKLKMELVVHKDAPRAKLDKRITFSVNEATNVELFKAIGRAAGLKVQFDTGVVYVIDNELP